MAWFGPKTCRRCFQGEEAILFVAVEVLQELWGVQEITLETQAAASKSFASELLDACLHEKMRALRGEVADAPANDPEAVAAHVAATGHAIVVRHNKRYKGNLRLVSQTPVAIAHGSLHGFVLCRGDKSLRNETRRLRLGMTLRGCSVKEAEDAQLFRAMGKLFRRQGTRPGRVAFIVLAPRLNSDRPVHVDDLHLLETGTKREDDLRFFGSFAHTNGNKLLFFPGFPPSKFSMNHTDGHAAIEVQDAELDHLTLEENLQEWHITGLKANGSNHYEGPFKTRSVAPGIFHWFSLGIQDGRAFYKMAENNWIEADLPASDFERRRLEATRTIKEASYSIMAGGDNRANQAKGFWYFEVFAANAVGLHLPRDYAVAVPSHAGAVDLTERSPLDVEVHRIQFQTFKGELFIIATRLPGTLAGPVSVIFPVVKPWQKTEATNKR